MRRDRYTVDERPGSAPDIRTSGTNVTFMMRVAGRPKTERLIIRCETDGTIRVAIETDEPSSSCPPFRLS